MVRVHPIMGWMILAISLTFCSSSWGLSPTKHKLPTPRGYVSDYAQILNDEWYAQIRAVCKDLESNAGIEMLVVTLDTIKPFPHAQTYASKLYEEWRIGTAQQDRGILLLVAVQERQAVVVVGKSLLPVVTPATLDELSEKFLQPMFQSENYAENVHRSALSLATITGKSSMSTPPVRPKKKAGFWMNLTAIILMFYALWRYTRPEKRHPFPRWKRGEYWNTGQGGFGGNFGGFGGGTGGQGLGPDSKTP